MSQTQALGIGMEHMQPPVPVPATAAAAVPAQSCQAQPATGAQACQIQPPVPMPMPSGWAPGTQVQLSGLANQPAFNGAQGTVSGFDAELGRYNILLDAGQGSEKRRTVEVKAENLMLSTPPPAMSSGKAKLMLDQLIIEEPAEWQR